MSPSEFDLRAALREGEGEVPAVHRVIAQAQRKQRERRQRIRGIAVGVSVAAVMVGGFTALALNKPTEDAGGVDNSAQGGGAAYAPADTADVPRSANSRPAGSSSSARSAIDGSSADSDCPAQLPHLASGSVTVDRLFATNISSFTSVTVCRYGSSQSTEPAEAAVVLDGEAGRQFTNRLEDGDHGTPYCLTLRSYAYAVVARDAQGNDDVVTAKAACHNYGVTNGIVIRFVSTETLDGLFDGTSEPSPNHGSPLK